MLRDAVEVPIRLQTTMLVSMLVLFSSCMALAQSKKPDSDTVLVRVSYSVSGEDATDWQSQDSLPSCFALYRSGYYQMSRTIGGFIPRAIRNYNEVPQVAL
jgi:hypothetical protein